MIEIVPATPELVRAFFGKEAPFTFRGHAALKDGAVIGLGGVKYVGGRAVLFSDRKPGLTRKEIVRCFRFLEAEIARVRRPLLASCDPAIPAARRTLERLGFTGPDDAMIRRPA